MKETPLKSYIKNVIFDRYPAHQLFNYIFLPIAIYMLLYGLKCGYHFLIKWALVIFAINFIYVVISGFIGGLIDEYFLYKKHEYGKPKITEEERQEVRKRIGFDIIRRLNDLEEKVTSLQRSSFHKIDIILGIYALLISIAFAIAIPLILRYIQ